MPEETTTTRVANPYNSTPFTTCCNVASLGGYCDKCGRKIVSHDDGLNAVRRATKPGCCLMCGKPRGNPAIFGNCCC